MTVISVIVPVYNVEKYLRACIDSILNQTYNDFELILVDDGSPDNCGMICDEYAKKDRRIRVIHQDNAGLSAARNSGIDIAKGEYISFIDSDDLVPEDFFEKMITVAIDENADVCSCKMKEFCDEMPKAIYAPQISVLSGKEACLKIYQGDSGIWVSACDKIYRRKLFDLIKFPVGMLHEDQATIPRVLYSASKVVMTNNEIYFYRNRNDSIMHQCFSTKRFDEMKAIEMCIDFFTEKKEEEIVQVAIMRKQILNSLYVLYAKQAGVSKQVPDKYKMSEFKALSNLRKLCTYDKYTYHLAKVHPLWVKILPYFQKIKKIYDVKKI